MEVVVAWSLFLLMILIVILMTAKLNDKDEKLAQQEKELKLDKSSCFNIDNYVFHIRPLRSVSTKTFMITVEYSNKIPNFLKHIDHLAVEAIPPHYKNTFSVFTVSADSLEDAELRVKVIVNCYKLTCKNNHSKGSKKE